MRKIILLSLLFLVGCSAPSGAEIPKGYDAAPLREDPNIQLAIAGAQLTGTAQAWSMQQVAWTVTAQSWTPTPAPTVTPTFTPTISPTPTVDVTGTMAVEYMNAELRDLQREEKRKEATNTVMAWLPYLVFVLALGLALFVGYIAAKRLAMVPTPIHEGTGKPQPLLNVLDAVVIDPDRMVNGAGVVSGKWVKALPLITAARQDEVTARAQLVDMKSRTKVTSAALNQLLKTQGLDAPKAVGQLSAGDEAGVDGRLFPLPAWELVNGWQGEKNILPIGLTATGLGLVNVDQFPHMATIGKTGEGKSRRFFRPLIACALAAGHRVVVVGKTTDYVVFAGHPNMTIVKVAQMTQPEHAGRYVAILKALVEEMNRRDEYLSTVNRSTWAHAGRERTFIVLDELGNAMRLMPTGMAEQARIWVEGLVSEGRKVGFNVAVANQRATGMAGILSQTGKAIFRVERDEEKAHRSLAGASALQEGYFYARFGGAHLTGSFEPSDDEIKRFLDSRPAMPLELDWVDGHIVDTFALPPEPAKESLPEPEPMPTADEIGEDDMRRIVQLLSLGESTSAVVRQVFGTTGGGKFLRLNDKVKEIKSSLEGVV